jgi:fatty-acyl-CoA synthase
MRAAPPFDEKAARRRAKADWLRALERTADVSPASTRTLAAIVDERAKEQPDRPALIGETATLTYAALAARSSRIARWAVAQHLAQGDCVALMMGNAPDYVAIWLGLSRLGIVTALVNTQLSGASLASCIATAGARTIIADADALAALRGIDLPDAQVWAHGADDDTPRLDEALASLSGASLDPQPQIQLSATALLVYTSGTTGMPKAARVSHYRCVMWAEWFAGLMDARPDDRLYDCLPMYHSVGGVVAVGAMLAAGGAVIVRPSFSASGFWQDVHTSRATIFQYIGELCRYLVQGAGAAPPAHDLRLCIGNGLRGDVWEAFQSRFAIPRIIEFYAATEGTFSLFNVEGKPGAIGRTPPFIAHRTPTAIVKFDHDSALPLRGADGFCQRCEADEPGEAIGRIDQAREGLSTRFEGYTNDADTARKILRDVFEPDDAWFRTGDLMRQDAQGYWYFEDRIGDTFRWKGENVSTAQVAGLLCALPGVLDAAVYGVALPGAEGRCGMAALVVGDSFDIAAFARGVRREIPRYAQPQFLRIRDGLSTTGTFRAKKADLQKDGFDPLATADALYFLDSATGEYRPLDAAAFARIMSGAQRF